jgi:acyl carrier protein
VTESASFIDDLGADSLIRSSSHGLRRRVRCEIPDDAAETILTVGDAIKFLEKSSPAA